MDEMEWQLLEDRSELLDVTVDGVEIKTGDRVRLRPRAGGDIFDLALAGRVAIIESIEQDYEDNVHLAVVLEDDPGRDLGMLRQPGHRFFFYTRGDRAAWKLIMAEKRILIACIGNIFLGDDAFGCEVARLLVERELPQNVRVTDFGIRSFDLAYALMDGYDVTVFVDATPRGEPPGTVYLIEPDLDEVEEVAAHGEPFEAHGMNPLKVLGMVKMLGGEFKKIYLVGCEPLFTGEDGEGHMGLSGPVQASLGKAVEVVESVIERVRSAAREQVLA